jgi:hypothetical protein
MARMIRYTPLRQAPPLPISCPRCGGRDISGPHFIMERRESKTGRSPGLARRTWFCRACWVTDDSLFELGPQQPLPSSGTARRDPHDEKAVNTATKDARTGG